MRSKPFAFMVGIVVVMGLIALPVDTASAQVDDEHSQGNSSQTYDGAYTDSTLNFGFNQHREWFKSESNTSAFISDRDTNWYNGPGYQSSGYDADGKYTASAGSYNSSLTKTGKNAGFAATKTASSSDSGTFYNSEYNSQSRYSYESSNAEYMQAGASTKATTNSNQRELIKSDSYAREGYRNAYNNSQGDANRSQGGSSVVNTLVNNSTDRGERKSANTTNQTTALYEYGNTYGGQEYEFSENEYARGNAVATGKLKPNGTMNSASHVEAEQGYYNSDDAELLFIAETPGEEPGYYVGATGEARSRYNANRDRFTNTAEVTHTDYGIDTDGPSHTDPVYAVLPNGLPLGAAIPLDGLRGAGGPVLPGGAGMVEAGAGNRNGLGAVDSFAHVDLQAMTDGDDRWGQNMSPRAEAANAMSPRGYTGHSGADITNTWNDEDAGDEYYSASNGAWGVKGVTDTSHSEDSPYNVSLDGAAVGDYYTDMSQSPESYYSSADAYGAGAGNIGLIADGAQVSASGSAAGWAEYNYERYNDALPGDLLLLEGEGGDEQYSYVNAELAGGVGAGFEARDLISEGSMFKGSASLSVVTDGWQYGDFRHELAGFERGGFPGEMPTFDIAITGAASGQFEGFLPDGEGVPRYTNVAGSGAFGVVVDAAEILNDFDGGYDLPAIQQVPLAMATSSALNIAGLPRVLNAINYIDYAAVAASGVDLSQSADEYRDSEGRPTVSTDLYNVAAVYNPENRVPELFDNPVWHGPAPEHQIYTDINILHEYTLNYDHDYMFESLAWMESMSDIQDGDTVIGAVKGSMILKLNDVRIYRQKFSWDVTQEDLYFEELFDHTFDAVSGDLLTIQLHMEAALYSMDLNSFLLMSGMETDLFKTHNPMGAFTLVRRNVSGSNSIANEHLPEPASMMLFGTGLVGFLMKRKKK